VQQTPQAPLKGIALTVTAMAVFASQDAITKTLVGTLPVPVVIVVRYWAFALMVWLWIGRKPGGVTLALRSGRPLLQWARGALLAFEIGVFAYVVGQLPLSASQAIFAACPLLVVALSSAFLGEPVSKLRWIAVLFGLTGVFIIVRPDEGVFDPVSIIALGGAAMFAVYSILTRLTGREDRLETSLLYQAWVGAGLASLIVPYFWVWPTAIEWLWLAVLSATSITGHVMLTKALALAPASLLQPFTYLHLLCGMLLGVVFFAEYPDRWMLAGAAIIVTGGVLAMRTR